MPDTRRHRGPHPEDARLFAPEHLPRLQQAAAELAWLLDRGYALRSSLALVGNRHELAERQRLALARCSCDESQRQRRASRLFPADAIAGEEIWIDGYNLLIAIESALGGGVILAGRDGCFRDLASLHGTYRQVTETTAALQLIGAALARWRVARCRWFLDRPVSNSARLRTTLLDLASAAGWTWNVQLEFSPDKLLKETAALVISSDSVVLDTCARWVNGAREIITAHIPAAFVVRLDAGPRDSSPVGRESGTSLP